MYHFASNTTVSSLLHSQSRRNILSREKKDTILAPLNTHRAQLTEPYLFADPNDPAEVAALDLIADWVTDYIDPSENPREPCGDFYYPILTDATDGVNLFKSGHTASNETLAGLMVISFYWRDMMKEILPPSEEGVVIVFENECAPTFTYQIDGPKARYLGFGDLHETRFDYLEQAAWFHQLNTFSVRKSDYTGVPLNEETCSTLLRIFPSSTFEENHVTNQPIVFTVVAILTFALIAVVFCVYDLYVRRRQKLVLDSAERTTAIVDSFFPAGVRERLFATEDSVKNDLGFKWSSKTKDAIGGSPADGLAITHPSKQAIADVFSDTTVFFGDIAILPLFLAKKAPWKAYR